MLVIDGDKAERNRELDKTLFQRWQGTQQAKQETRHAHLVSDPDQSVTKWERQRGNAMTSTTFIAKVRKINANLSFDDHPNPTKISIFLLLPNGKREFLVVMDNGKLAPDGLVPEWSIMGTMEVRNHDGSKEKIPGMELLRGWRTVLLRLVMKGLLPLEETERTFGPCNRESWKNLTGKGKGVLPI